MELTDQPLRRVSGSLSLDVGFNPRSGQAIRARRVATVEFSRRSRDAGAFPYLPWVETHV